MSTAPRVTIDDIEANIASEHYFRAGDAAFPADAISEQSFKAFMNMQRTTICVLVLKNGFTVTGESACVSLENYDANEGRKYARQSAIDKLWPLMGYALKQNLYEAAQ